MVQAALPAIRLNRSLLMTDPSIERSIASTQGGGRYRDVVAKRSEARVAQGAGRAASREPVRRLERTEGAD